MSHSSQPYDGSRNKSPAPFPQNSMHLSQFSVSSQYPAANRQSSEFYRQDSLTNQSTYTQRNEENNKNFKVMVRIRPPLPREIENGHLISTIQTTHDQKRISINEYYNIEALDPSNPSEYLENNNMFTTHNFTFDRVYDPNSSQNEVYNDTAKPAVMSVLQGYNATILAYGQTGTGKTFTMEGFKFNGQDPQRGIVPRSMEEIFKYIENLSSNSRTTFMVRVSYLQIYNEIISDLLRTDRSNLHIREDKKKGVFVEGLSEWAVRSPHEIYTLIQKGALNRATAATRMNDMSSRSHAVFIIIVEQMTTTLDEDTGEEYQEIRVGKLNLVDLAGSERVRVTGATGKRLEECKKINQSLSALGNVISSLADQKQNRTHIPYRDAKITRLLEDSLGGNCITTMMAMVSPTIDAFGESLSTLKFANRAKNIKNAPIINEDADQKALLRKYEAELKKLRGELDEKNKVFADKKRVMQLEEDKRKAEQDKHEAYAALEARSREFIQEREEKKKLEEKIGSMYSQMLVGGKKPEDTPQFRNALEEQQKLIRKQYEQRLNDLEKERQVIEEDKAQVDRYKQLLLKQRDIMIALTTRLNERDETIIQLQEELDAYDRIHRETEDQLEMRDRRVLDLETILKDNQLPIPKDNRLDTDYNEPILRTLSDPPKYRDEVQNRSSEEDAQEGEKQQEGDPKTLQAIESLEGQLKKMMERVKKSEDEQNKLKDTIYRKDEQIKTLQNQFITDPNLKTENIMFIHKEIKLNVDCIIESLSSQSEPQRLQDVARDLLNLQKLCNSIPSVPVSDSKENIESTPMKKNTEPNLPMKTPEQQQNLIEISNRSIPTTETKAESAAINMNRVVSEPLAVQAQVLQSSSKTPSSKSVIEETPKANNIKEQQSENKLSQASPNMKSGGDSSKKAADNKLLEATKRNISTGIFGKYMGNLVNLDPERKPMTVEEMLKMKRDQPAKKK